MLKLSALDISTTNIPALAAKIAGALSGKSEFPLLEIDAYAQAGLAQEVYPSEELVLDKGKRQTTVPEF